ncbi:MAG TPA: sugar phosphate isomerase/epimerase family protein [Candidatus Nitrosopolaris rasttigaisensis]|jgi:sugar phosphate isomerase/epimerase|nr:sugar phosphate isomerase/epimerase family protein [Candidatus Nitrosopolaris rasttigaisensis]
MQQQKNKVPKFGLLTNPSINIIDEIKEIRRLNFDYVEIGIEGPEGNPCIIVDKLNEIVKLLLKFDDKPVGHTAHWIDLGSDYERIRQAWISEAIEEAKLAKELGIHVINFHSSAKGMFFGERRKMILDNWIKSLHEIISHTKRLGVQIMLENVPNSSSGIHKLDEFKYIIDNVQGLNVHLDIPHAFTSGGMQAITDYIRTFREKIVHIHWHDNHGAYDEHLPIGEGLIDHKKVVKELKNINYKGTITFEVFTGKQDAKDSANKLKELWMID